MQVTCRHGRTSKVAFMPSSVMRTYISQDVQALGHKAREVFRRPVLGSRKTSALILPTGVGRRSTFSTCRQNGMRRKSKNTDFTKDGQQNFRGTVGLGEGDVIIKNEGRAVGRSQSGTLKGKGGMPFREGGRS